MPTPHQPSRPEKPQYDISQAEAPRSYRNDLLIPLANRIRSLRADAASIQADGFSPFELLIETRPARLELAERLGEAQGKIENQLDAQHRSRLAAYRLFLHGMVLVPPLMAYGPEDTDARAIRHVTGSGIHPTITALAAQVAKSDNYTRRVDHRPAATRETMLLALGARMADPDRIILPALTHSAFQEEQEEYFAYDDDGQVMHTHVFLNGDSRYPVAGRPGLAVVSRNNLRLVTDRHPWNSLTSSRTTFALEDELRWRQTPLHNQNREDMHEIRTGLDTITRDVMHILDGHLIAYDPTA